MTRLAERTEQTGVEVVPGPLPPIGSPLRMRALQIAGAEIARGVEERPRGSNAGPDVDKYLRGHDGGGQWLVDLPAKEKPWCACASIWCFREAARLLQQPDPFDGAADKGKLCSGRRLRDWAKPHVGLAFIGEPGDIGVIMHQDESSHVVMLWDVLPGAKFVSAEGNSDNRFRHVRRKLTEVSFWIRLVDKPKEP